MIKKQDTILFHNGKEGTRIYLKDYKIIVSDFTKKDNRKIRNYQIKLLTNMKKKKRALKSVK